PAPGGGVRPQPARRALQHPRQARRLSAEDQARAAQQLLRYAALLAVPRQSGAWRGSAAARRTYHQRLYVGVLRSLSAGDRSADPRRRAARAVGADVPPLRRPENAAQAWQRSGGGGLERFRAKHVLGLDPRMESGSRQENATKQRLGVVHR